MAIKVKTSLLAAGRKTDIDCLLVIVHAKTYTLAGQKNGYIFRIHPENLSQCFPIRDSGNKCNALLQKLTKTLNLKLPLIKNCRLHE